MNGAYLADGCTNSFQSNYAFLSLRASFLYAA